MKLNKYIFFITLFFGVTYSSFAQKNEYNIIPAPLSLKESKGVFVFENETFLYLDKGVNTEVENTFFLLNTKLEKVAGIKIKKSDVAKSKNVIVCRLNKSLGNREAYRLNISPDKIEIEACETVGFFYAAQTLRQLLPPVLESKTKVADIEWSVPCCRIEDSPVFSYRGLHLDVCRHFATVDEVKTYIDQISLLKLNTFHWHLTDDQGWRIEIKKFPKLTEVGAFRDRTMIGHHNDHPRKWDNARTGGFYTQDEIKDVIAYAKQRFVTIIPEIEMPGHATAALASYPEYSCSGGPFDVEGRWGVFNDVFCAKEETFSFIEGVLDEVSALFPGEYIHIGGDECPKIRWERCHACQQRIKEEGLKNEHELQSYFVKRIEKYLSKKGKRIIGWDEILDGGLAPDATVMSWRGIVGGVEAARQGHDVIMTPSSSMYFDFYQSQLSSQPLAIGGYLPIEKVYAYKAMPDELTEEQYKHILGIQANVWTEYMPTSEQREYMIFPRVAALAEVAWLPEEKKDYKKFSKGLSGLLSRYDYMGLNYSDAFYSVVGKTKPDKEDGLKLELSTSAPGLEIHYTTDGTEPALESPLYLSGIPVSGEALTIKAVSVKAGKIMSPPYGQTFIVNKAAGRKIIFEDSSGNKSEQDGGGNLTDCIMGKFPLGRNDWFSYAGGDAAITICFDKPEVVSELIFSSANQNNVYVYSPRKVEFFISADGDTFRSVGSVSHEQMASAEGKAILNIPATTVKKVKMAVTVYGIVPQDKVGAGNPSALFVDEVIVR
jgi:hexosaminidase